MTEPPTLPRAFELRAVVSDVDGVLTDGLVGLSASGHKFRMFHVHDGMGVQLLLAAGVKVGWMSSSHDDGVIRTRAEALRVHAIDVGEGDKGARFARLCERLGVLTKQALYLGDDVNDLPAFAVCGASACPADARPEIRAVATVALRSAGGRGAFREAADLALSHLGFTPAIAHGAVATLDQRPPA